jgi:alpha-ketoglutarate-dependent taurine dioxygenase
LSEDDAREGGLLTMNNTEAGKGARPTLGGAARRRGVTASQSSWVRAEDLDEGGRGPVVLSPALEGVDLVAWAGSNRDLIEGHLRVRGGVLFRGFGAGGAEELQRLIRAVSGEPLDYGERSSPRRPVSGRVYTSTDYPAHQPIFFHNENSYQRVWPMKLFFYCDAPAERGGETPTADTRQVLRLLSPRTVARFAERGIMYVRNFGEELGLPWRTVFQTDDPAAVEDYCRGAGIAFEWVGGDRLRTRAVRHALAAHPGTGERVWFNHAAFFHVSTLDPSIRDGLLATMPEEELPSNTYYGDGSPIEPEALDEIRDGYHRASVSFSWRRGDTLLLDNMLRAHSRTPYAGERRVLVGMSEPHRQ